MAITAESIQTALFWRRFTAIGWSLFYAFMLHFVILLTRDDYTLKKPSPILALLYLPSFASIYIFTLSDKMVAMQYDLIRTKFGWTNVNVNNLFDWLFNLYYASYMLVALMLLWAWKKRSRDKKTSSQANIIFVSVLLSFLIGSLVYICILSNLTQALPQLAPLFILFPTYAMYYSIKYYGLIKPENIEKDELILKEKNVNRIFLNIGYGFSIGGLLSFMFEYLYSSEVGNFDLRLALIKSGFLLIMGLGLILCQVLTKDLLRENLSIIILTFSIPIITFQFLEYAGKTIWVFPLVIIISSVIFNKKNLMIATSIISIVTQRLFWILKPNLLITINKYDYITRISIFILAASVAYYVHNIYIAKIKENNYQMDFQKMNSKFSSEFININKENFPNYINIFLSEIGGFFNVDRSYLFLIDQENNTMTYSHEWCNQGIGKTINPLKEIPLDNLSWWLDSFKKDNFFLIEDTNNMPQETIIEQNLLQQLGVKSLLVVSIEGNNSIQGFLGFQSVENYKKWSGDDIELTHILSSLIANVLIKTKTEETIEHMAYYDNLTHLPNRFIFLINLNQAIELAKRNKKSLAVVFIDLDDFKSVNDSLGHSGGDILLKQFAQSIKKRIRKIDLVSRFGGDEFVILLNNIQNPKYIKKVVEDLMKQFDKPFNIFDQEVFITGSAGISVYPIDGLDAETLIKNADAAMYKAKSKGKNQYLMCTSDLKDEIQRNIILSNDLYRALEQDEFILYYQTQVELPRVEITGIESLLYWNHPEYGMLAPRVLLPLIEKNTLSAKIDKWVLRQSCIQCKKWQNMGLNDLKISVNLSTSQFIDPDLTYKIEKILKETGLESKYLEIEISESIAIKNPHCALDILTKLKNIGVSIALDNFGMEYSSLSHLKVLPIDKIKIDTQFTKGIEKNEKDRAIIMVLIDLAKSLNLDIIADGVENKSQLEFLIQKMCDYAQGLYFHKPSQANDIDKILRA